MLYVLLNGVEMASTRDVLHAALNGGGVVLAPMVRLGTLPLRLLALERGAAAVYTEEIIATKLAATVRRHDSGLGLTTWLGAGGQHVLATCARERGRLIVQLGVSSGEAALAALAILIDPAEPAIPPGSSGARYAR